MMPTASYKMKSTIVKKKKKLLLTGCTNKKTDYYDQKKIKKGCRKYFLTVRRKNMKSFNVSFKGRMI